MPTGTPRRGPCSSVNDHSSTFRRRVARPEALNDSETPQIGQNAGRSASRTGRHFAERGQINGRALQRVSGKEIELAVPRETLGIKGQSLDFEFKWIDNAPPRCDVMDFYQYGDAAPAGRFNYVYRENTP
jgi:hypothetical protein